MQIARRIEEMSTDETRPIGRGQRRCHLRDRQTRCIGADDRIGLQMRRNLLEQGTLDVELFHHRFEDPVATFKKREIIFKISNTHSARPPRGVERCRFGFECALEATARERVAVCARRRIAFHVGALRRYNVEQQCGNARIGQMRRQRAAHHSRAQHRGAFD
jgi:hypothetical protein